MNFIENIEENEYVNFEENHKKSHFLQSYSWGQFAITGKKQQPIYVGMKDEKGSLLCAALFLKKALPLGYSYIYCPRGFVIDFDNKDLLENFTKSLKDYMKKNKIIYIKLDPDIKYQTIDKDANPIEGKNNKELLNTMIKLGYKHKGFNKLYEGNQPRYTYRIDLSKSKEEIDTGFDKSFMKSIKRSYNYDLEITNDIIPDEFYNLIQFNSEKDDFHSYSKKYYTDFTKQFSKYNNVKYYNAYLYPNKVYEKLTSNLKELNTKLETDKKHEVDIKNQIERTKKDLEKFEEIKDEEKLLVCSLICVYTKTKAWSLYIGNDDLGTSTFAVSRCYYDSIIDAKENGYEFYDLFGTVGDPNTKYKNLAKLNDYKRKFGGEYVEFIGEFDLVNNKLLYNLLPIMLKVYRKVKKS